MTSKRFRGLRSAYPFAAGRGARSLVALVGVTTVLACLLACWKIPQARADEFVGEDMVLAVHGDDSVSGTWGKCPWVLDSEGILTIAPGTGADTDSECPWDDVKERVVSIRIVSQDGTKVIAPADCSYLFDGFSNLVSADLSSLDTSHVTDMSAMFSGCKSLVALDGISQLDTSQVSSMSYLFDGCSTLTSLDLTTWDTSSLKTMDYMFSDCSALTSLDLSNWKTSQVEDMNYLFFSCFKLTSLDLATWDTSSLKTMEHMFCFCSSLKRLDLSGWATATAEYFDDMFSGCEALSEIKVGETYAIQGADMFPEATSGKGWWSLKDRTWYSHDEIFRRRSGVADTYLAAEPAAAPSFEGCSLLLADEIGMRFRVSFPEGFDATGCSMHFAAADGRKGDVAYEEAERIENDAYFSFGVNALELADRVTATLTYGGGQTLEKEFSAMDYITYVQGHPDEYDSELDLAGALQSWGHYMQRSGWTDDRTHAGIAAPAATPDVDAALSGLAGYEIAKSGPGIADARASLLLNAKTALTISVLPEEGVTITGYKGTSTIDGKTYYVFERRGIGPRKLGDAFQTVIGTSSGQATVTCAPMAYVKALMGTDLTVNQRLAMAAYYEYFQAAVAYQG